MSNSTISRAAAGLGAFALVAGGAALVATPAHAASASLRYTCSSTINLGGNPATLSIPVDVVLNTDVPATLPPGITTPVFNGTADVTVLPEPGGLDYPNLFRGMADTVKGSATVGTTLDGAAKSSNFTVAEQKLSTSGPLVIKAAGPLYSVATGAAGATHVIAADNIKISAQLTKEGQPAGVPSIDLDCTKPATGDLTISTATVTADAPPPVVVADTTTSVKATYKKGLITAKVAVTGVTSGKVTVDVKGPKKFKKKVTATVTNGKATVKIKKIKVKGKYTVKVSLAATATNKASTGKATVKVK